MTAREDAAVLADQFSAHQDPDRLFVELQNERCRRAGLPARWWIYEAGRKTRHSFGWCERKKFIEGSTVVSKLDLDKRAYRKDTWGERLAEANVCVVHTTQFYVIDVDTKDLEQLRVALIQTRERLGYDRDSWQFRYESVDFEQYTRVETPRGYHFYTHAPSLPAEYMRESELGCRRLTNYPIDLKWSGIVVVPGSEVDGVLYRERNEVFAPGWWFTDLLTLSGKNLKRYPPE